LGWDISRRTELVHAWESEGNILKRYRQACESFLSDTPFREKKRGGII